jgi:hypothetical protein
VEEDRRHGRERKLQPLIVHLPEFFLGRPLQTKRLLSVSIGIGFSQVFIVG